MLGPRRHPRPDARQGGWTSTRPPAGRPAPSTSPVDRRVTDQRRG